VLPAPTYSNAVKERQPMSIYCPLAEALGISTTVSILDIEDGFFDCYGNHLPPWNKGIPHTEETKRLISEKAKLRPSSRKGAILSEETKRKISEAKKNQNSGINNPMFDRKHTDETKKAWSLLRKGQNKGKNNPMFGKKHSEETKRKISEAKTKR
jgi:hypothetical protein